MKQADAVTSTLNNNNNSATDGFFAKPLSPSGFMTDSLDDPAFMTPQATPWSARNRSAGRRLRSRIATECQERAGQAVLSRRNNRLSISQIVATITSRITPSTP